METAKQLAMKVLQAMPDDCTWEQICRDTRPNLASMPRTSPLAMRRLPNEIL